LVLPPTFPRRTYVHHWTAFVSLLLPNFRPSPPWLYRSSGFFIRRPFSVCGCAAFKVRRLSSFFFSHSPPPVWIRAACHRFFAYPRQVFINPPKKFFPLLSFSGNSSRAFSRFSNSEAVRPFWRVLYLLLLELLLLEPLQPSVPPPSSAHRFMFYHSKPRWLLFRFPRCFQRTRFSILEVPGDDYFIRGNHADLFKGFIFPNHWPG